MLNNTQIAQIEQTIQYVFRNKTLLNTAFTHTSYANETGEPDNERFEFLGDSILNFVVAERLFRSSSEDEGDLSAMRSAIVSRTPLSKAVEGLGVLPYYQMGAGAKKEENISEKFKSNLFEAILGAIYLDSANLVPVTKFIETFLMTKMPVNAENNNYKSILQQFLQAKKMTWNYSTRLDGKGGFTSCLQIGDEHFVGAGRKKQEAEQRAAQYACERLGCRNSK